MSGGVDSSVTAALLVEQGYEVIGMMMRLWSEPCRVGEPTPNRCCTPDQIADARRIADQLNIPFYVLDSQETFRREIVQFFIDEHAQGRTPNPCIQCNRQIRFTYLLNQAFALDANYLATGHYARIRPVSVERFGKSFKRDLPNRATETAVNYQLLKGIDETKDQSYVLHVLTQEKLAHVLFPVGEFTKTEVRALARKFNLPVASKHDSQDLCFVSDGDYRRFLREYSPDSHNPGPILAEDGRLLGQHTGLSSYTIGQRKGLGISAPQPLYVLRKEAAQNALVVGPRERLGQRHLTARDVNWIAGSAPTGPVRAQVKIRYKATAVLAVITSSQDNRVLVQFDEPVMGITAGQGAVFYDDDVCLGGGIIE